jgi:hypothetical protein
MRILIVLDPLASIKTYKDTTYAMMVAAVARGHAIAVCEMPQLCLADGHAWADATTLELSGPQLGEPNHDPHDWWRLGETRTERRGSRGNPMSAADHDAKFRDCAAHVLDPAGTDAALRAIAGLAEGGDAVTLVVTLLPRKPA